MVRFTFTRSQFNLPPLFLSLVSQPKLVKTAVFSITRELLSGSARSNVTSNTSHFKNDNDRNIRAGSARVRFSCTRGSVQLPLTAVNVAACLIGRQLGVPACTCVPRCTSACRSCEDTSVRCTSGSGYECRNLSQMPQTLL
ncbi:hypothetical protein M9458_045589, partial [Cirrhinus mrigala]